VATVYSLLREPSLSLLGAHIVVAFYVSLLSSNISYLEPSLVARETATSYASGFATMLAFLFFEASGYGLPPEPRISVLAKFLFSIE
jgi:hypothetical protein